MQAVQDIQVGDLVVVTLPPLLAPHEEETKRVRGIVEAIAGDEVTVRVAEVAETADPDAPLVVCKRADVVPAPIAEVP